MTTEIEATRKALFLAHPGFSDYLATMLQDLQFSESDEACTEGREARDSGTIYTLPATTFDRSLEDWQRFASECVWHINAALKLEPGEPGLQWTRDRYMTAERIGLTLWLARVGSGVTFTDDGDAPCLVEMAEWARRNSIEGPYFGDDGSVYLS